MNELIIYPNASKGGITSVIRGRATTYPNIQFDAIFFEDRGGSQAFSDLPNVSISIIPQSRAESAIEYLVQKKNYASISILSYPAIVKRLEGCSNHIRYEFHSSDMAVNQREIDVLALSAVDEITVPTSFMAEMLRPALPVRHRQKLSVLPNLVDSKIFGTNGAIDFYASNQPESNNKVPLVWVGRFDDGKGYRHFLRVLAGLPDQYYGIVVISLEKDPARASAFFNECTAMGVFDRVELYLNQPQTEMAKLYRWASMRGGRAVSTSLLESFGYFIAEATACGLPVIAFDLPVWSEHQNKHLITTVTIGSVTQLIEAIKG